MLKKIFLSVLFLLMAMPASGEYYQYKDQNGNVRFTDDLYKVPADQRSAMKTYESVQNDPLQAPVANDGDRSAMTEETSENSDQFFEETPEQELEEENSEQFTEEPPEQEPQVDSRELDRLQADLNDRYKSIEAAKKANEAQKPPKGSTTKEKVLYIDKVEALNAEIAQYEQQRAEFEKKVKAFNARHKSK